MIRTLVFFAMLASSMAENFSGYVAIVSAQEEKQGEMFVQVIHSAEGEAKFMEDALTFKAAVVYNNFDQDHFDGTIEFNLGDGDVVKATFEGAQVSRGLDDQGFFPIEPSPLQATIVGGEGKFEGASGFLDLRGRVLPGGHDQTFFNFEGDLIQ